MVFAAAKCQVSNSPGVISAESEHDVAVVGHGDRIFLGWQVVLTVQQTATIQIERMLQVDLLDGRVGRSADTYGRKIIEIEIRNHKKSRRLVIGNGILHEKKTYR